MLAWLLQLLEQLPQAFPKGKQSNKKIGTVKSARLAVFSFASAAGADDFADTF